jgi:hypothetical protein
MEYLFCSPNEALCIFLSSAYIRLALINIPYQCQFCLWVEVQIA